MLRETRLQASSRSTTSGFCHGDKLSGNQAAKLRCRLTECRSFGEGSDDERLIYDTIEDNNGLTLFDLMGLPVIGPTSLQLQ